MNGKNLRLGLCCKFYKEPIRFRATTAKYIGGLCREERLKALSGLCLNNAGSLLSAIEYCAGNGIGSFRITSRILPLKTYPRLGYEISGLPSGGEIYSAFLACRSRASELGVRLTFHPDQFVLLNSDKPGVVERSVEELDYQAGMCELTGADVMTIHAGGGYGDKPKALKRLGEAVTKLNKRIRCRLALENDDRIYSPADLLPFCRKFKIPFVYDVHHHRCLPDGLSVGEVTGLAIKTWDREPLFHISSPKYPGVSKYCSRHADYIRKGDFPREWRDLKINITVEVEAKAKELAVMKLKAS